MFHLDKFDPAAVAEALNEQGHCVIEAFFEPSLIEAMERFVRTEANEHGNEYFSYSGIRNLAASPSANVARHDGFRSRLAKTCEIGMGHRYFETQHEIYHVLRALIGRTGVGRSHRYHFDAYSITALMPVVIPDVQDRPTGDLFIYPNFRPEYPGVLANVVSKVRWQNPVARSQVQRPDFVERHGRVRLKLKPGNLYLFWGTRTLHGNEHCDTDSLRATALFHYGNPHAESGLLNAMQDARNWYEARVRESREV